MVRDHFLFVGSWPQSYFCCCHLVSRMLRKKRLAQQKAEKEPVVDERRKQKFVDRKARNNTLFTFKNPMSGKAVMISQEMAYFLIVVLVGLVIMIFRWLGA
eukprot:TRINITY_DN2203_c0_g1_i2.p1 TRINITY_DN2203_c0_g1~~TRINITY_DN2203_c0_g1_i2.p1  ORF type:complete len:101 (+),score=13.43 TRINITY_DN2203_c0_g1_i2:194-496(+)